MMFIRLTVWIVLAIKVAWSCKDHLVSGPKGIADNQISASSQYNEDQAPKRARLNTEGVSWCSSYQNRLSSYIQVTFNYPKTVVGVITQGKNSYDQWVTSYTLQYSFDGSYFAFVLDQGGSSQVFEGNKDRNTQKIQMLNYPIEMKVLRLNIRTYHGFPCMRFEVLGCDTISGNCTDYLVSGPEGIMDSKMTASSQRDVNHAPALARLDNEGNNWCPKEGDAASPFIQVEFDGFKSVMGVVTQGKSDKGQWVTKYAIQYSYNGQNWVTVVNNDKSEKVFDGNVDQNTKKINNLERPVTVKFLRVYPKSYQGWPCMRLDVIGCNAVGFKKCTEFFLTGPNAVSDKKLYANSNYNGYHRASYARLFSTSGENWCPTYGYRYKSYIQVNFNSIKAIAGVVTQGQHNDDYWVTSYTLQYSFDGYHFTAVSHPDGNEKVFEGNSARHTPKINMFTYPIEMVVLRMMVKGFYGFPCLRFDVLGCDTIKNSGCGDYLVSGPNPVPDEKITASSNGTYQPANSRLNATGDNWCREEGDSDPYLQVEFDRLKKVTGIVTQGRENRPHYVTEYYLDYSFDGKAWIILYDNNHNREVFRGNSDQNTVKLNKIENGIQAKFIRIRPRYWRSQPCLRFDALGCNIEGSKSLCAEYLISGPNGVADDKLFSSSDYNSFATAKLARLYNNAYWCPKTTGVQYIYVDFDTIVIAIGVITQGSHTSDQWITEYILQHSSDGNNWFTLLETDGKQQVFKGNTDRNTPKLNILKRTIRLRYLRLIPIKWYGFPCLKFDVLGCNSKDWERCSEYLISRPGGVVDNKLTESSIKSSSAKAQNARLFNTLEYGGWQPSSSDRNPYIQVEFNVISAISAIATQGGAKYPEWVNQYAVRYSLDASNWQNLQENGNEKLFIGNFDSHTPVFNHLKQMIQAKFLRIYPKTSHRFPVMRFEVLGCPILEKRQRFYGEFVALNVDNTVMNSSIWSKTKVADLDECLLSCYKDGDCLSFSFDKSQQKCNGYGALFYRNDAFHSDKLHFLQSVKDVYYFDRSLVDHFGYTVLEDIGLCYKIHTSLKSQNDAKAYCRSESARLFPIESLKQLQAFQNAKANNVILENSDELRVDGEYHGDGSSWRLFNNQEIRNELWSPSGKDPLSGKCVVMTKDGLKSGSCEEPMFFICGL